MKIKSAVFQVSAPDLKSCQQSTLGEFAFIGRSNVGKSSLINMLAERRDLAKVSITPGKTKLINFFAINNAWCLVDLPGYGYAKVAKEKRADFNEAVADYLENRENLLCTFVLIDANIPPQTIDLDFVRWMGDSNIPFVLVFTKIDKQAARHCEANIALFQQELAKKWGDELPGVIRTSSKTKSGRSDILETITETLADNKY